MIRRIKSVFRWIWSTPYHLQMLRQRIAWGFDDYEVFCLNNHLAAHIIPRLKRLQAKRNFDNDDMVQSIDKMIVAFEIYHECGGDLMTVSDEDKEKHKEGLQCFVDDFDGLWY